MLAAFVFLFAPLHAAGLDVRFGSGTLITSYGGNSCTNCSTVSFSPLFSLDAGLRIGDNWSFGLAYSRWNDREETFFSDNDLNDNVEARIRTSLLFLSRSFRSRSKISPFISLLGGHYSYTEHYDGKLARALVSNNIRQMIFGEEIGFRFFSAVDMCIFLQCRAIHVFRAVNSRTHLLCLTGVELRLGGRK